MEFQSSIVINLFQLIAPKVRSEKTNRTERCMRQGDRLDANVFVDDKVPVKL